MRTATAADAAAIARLVNRAFLVEAPLVSGDRTSPAAIAAMLEHGDFLLKEEGGELIACVYVEIRPETGYFGMLSVDPRQQGKGLGREMTYAAEDYFRQAGRRVVEIAVVNRREELPPFYRRLGYVEAGTKAFPDPHRAKVDDLHMTIMKKTL